MLSLKGICAMKIGGIIAEYNPFHNGHAFQVSEVKKECEGVVAVMSGSVVQRGSLAAFDKFFRAEAAVRGGVDLVLELPCAYSLAPAELFAKGAVSVLESTGVVDELYFGSECGDTKELSRIAELMLNEPPELSEKIKEKLKDGMGYKAAQLEAYSELVSPDILGLPNNVLGIEYIKALMSLGSKIKPHALLRKFVNHNDTSPSNGFASGNAIRDIYEQKKDIKAFIPEATHAMYDRAATFDRSKLDAIVLYMLRVTGLSVFDSVFDAPPEMVTRILRAIPNSTSLENILTKANSRQFSNARIRRAILSALLNIDGELTTSKPEYLRVLAFNDKGRDILADIKEKTGLPIITKAADYKEKTPMFNAEVRATELSSICRDVKRGLDFITSPIYLSEADLAPSAKKNAGKKKK